MKELKRRQIKNFLLGFIYVAGILGILASGGGGGGGGGDDVGDTGGDTSAPDTTIVNSPSDPSNSTNATFEFTSTEAGSTFQCSLNGAPLVDCTSPQNYAGLADGNYSFTVIFWVEVANTIPGSITHPFSIVPDVSY